MAIAGMSPGYPDAIRSFADGRPKKLGAHSPRAGDSDNPDIRRIFHSADTGQVGGPIAAPVTQKADDFRFPFGHVISTPLMVYCKCAYQIVGYKVSDNKYQALNSFIQRKNLRKNLLIIKSFQADGP